MRAILTLSNAMRLDVGIPDKFLHKPGKLIFLNKAEEMFREKFGKMIEHGLTIEKVHLIRTDL